MDENEPGEEIGLAVDGWRIQEMFDENDDVQWKKSDEIN